MFVVTGETPTPQVWSRAAALAAQAVLQLPDAARTLGHVLARAAAAPAARGQESIAEALRQTVADAAAFATPAAVETVLDALASAPRSR